MDNSNETISQKLYNFNDYDNESEDGLYESIINYYQKKEIEDIDNFIVTLKNTSEKLNNINIDLNKQLNDIKYVSDKYINELDELDDISHNLNEKSNSYDKFKKRSKCSK